MSDIAWKRYPNICTIFRTFRSAIHAAIFGASNHAVGVDDDGNDDDDDDEFDDDDEDEDEEGASWQRAIN